MVDAEPEIVVPAIPPYLSPQAVKDWIRAICAALSITPTELARRAQIAQTTLNRFLSGKSINKNLSGSTLASLASVINKAEQEGIIKIDRRLYTAYEEETPEGVERIRSLYKFIQISKRGYYIGKMYIEGFVGHGIAMDQNYPVDKKLLLRVPLRDPIYNMSLKGFEVREESNSQYPLGTILACIPEKVWALAFAGKPFESGAHCVIFQAAAEAGKIEGRIFRCELGLNANWWLVPTWAGADVSSQIFIGQNFWQGCVRHFPNCLHMIVATMRQEL